MKCEWCISSNCHEARDGSKGIRYPNLYRFMLDFKDYGGKALTFSGGGEPTFYPEFEPASFEAHEIGFDLGLMTNGFYHIRYNEFIGKFYKWVRFSLDTVNGEQYKKWKGVNSVGLILENIDGLKDMPVKVGVNCNVHEDLTPDDAEKLINQVKDKVEYIQFRPILPRFYVDESPKLNFTVWNHLRKYHSDNPKVNLSDDKFADMCDGVAFPYDSCEGHHFAPVLQANGDLDTCMYHPKEENFTFGNIYEEPFPVIWLSERRREIISWLRNGCNMEKRCQQCCKLHELNKFIDFVKHPHKQNDINFL